MNVVRWLLCAASLLSLSMAAACGGDDAAEEVGDGDATQPTSAGESTTAAVTGSGGSESGFSCPLSADFVGEVLGVSVEKNEATCSYLPGGNAGSTNAAGFIAQLPELCDDGFPEQAGYEPVDDLSEDAFLKVGGGATVDLWVCGDQSFTVFVDMGTDTEAATAAALELAKAVLE